MSSKNIVFDRFGNALDELDVAIIREWRLQRTVDAARGTFSISSRSPKATSRNLAIMNFIIAKTDDLPDWGGIIWPPRRSYNGNIDVTMRSAEWILGTRYTNAKDVLTGKPYQIFKQLLSIAVSNASLPINIDDAVCAQDGDDLSMECNFLNIYETINELASVTSHWWWLQPQIDNGILRFTPHFRARLGVEFPEQLKEGDNFTDVSVEEIGPEFANKIITWGRFDSWDAPLYVTLKRPSSISRYGLVEGIAPALDQTTTTALRQVAVSELEKRAFPYLSVTGIVTRSPYPSAGDRVRVSLPISGSFLLGSRGASFSMTVRSAAYSPVDNSMAVNLSEVITEDDLA